jgi:hypothetical protein
LQLDPACLPHFHEAITLHQRIGDHEAAAQDAGNLGSTYLHVPTLRDLDQAEYWFQHSLSQRDDNDRYSRARVLVALSQVAGQRFDDARAADEGDAVLLEHLNTALRACQQALDLTSADDHEQRGLIENQLGNLFMDAGETRRALRHYQQSIKHKEARGDAYGAGVTRYNVALLLADDGWASDALRYAYAAQENFREAGPGAAADDVTDAGKLIARLEQQVQ